MSAMQGDWVEVEITVLNPEKRPSYLPESTRKTPLKMWVRGFLQTNKGDIGNNVKIRTLSGRIVEGELVQTKPSHKYDYGETIPELLAAGEELKNQLRKVLESKRE